MVGAAAGGAEHAGASKQPIGLVLACRSHLEEHGQGEAALELSALAVLAARHQEHFLELPYHQAILNDQIPLSIGGGIGQSRTYMYLLRKGHLGECSVTIGPDQLKKICASRNIHVLE